MNRVGFCVSAKTEASAEGVLSFLFCDEEEWRRPVQTSALEYTLSHPDIGLRYNWETGWTFGSYFPLGRVVNWRHLSWPSTLALAWLLWFLRRASPGPSAREASISQFARGINWRWLSRAARRRHCVNSPRGAQKHLIDCCHRGECKMCARPQPNPLIQLLGPLKLLLAQAELAPLSACDSIGSKESWGFSGENSFCPTV